MDIADTDANRFPAAAGACRHVVTSLIALVFATSFVKAAASDEPPDPQPLDAHVTWSEETGEIASAIAHLRVQVAEVYSATSVSALRVQRDFSDAEARSTFTMRTGELAWRIGELERLSADEREFAVGQWCEAKVGCMQGVARCRPTRSEPQELCPIFYSRADGTDGFAITSAGRNYLFPGNDVSALQELLELAQEQLSKRSAGDEGGRSIPLVDAGELSPCDDELQYVERDAGMDFWPTAQTARAFGFPDAGYVYRNFTGEVVVDFTVSEDGTVLDPSIRDSRAQSHADRVSVPGIFDDKAREIVMGYRFPKVPEACLNSETVYWTNEGQPNRPK